MEKLNQGKVNNLPSIDGFHSGTLFYNSKIEFLISDETLINSNANIARSHMMDIYKLFIKPKLAEKGLDKDEVLNNSIIVLAHGSSNSNKWLIFGKKEDKQGFFIEDFLEELPKDKKVILYVCNQAGYEINNNDLDIIYPLDSTGSEKLKLKIQGDLINDLCF